MTFIPLSLHKGEWGSGGRPSLSKQFDMIKSRQKSGASAVSDGYSKTWHITFMIAVKGHLSEAKAANIQFIELFFPFEK